MKKTVRLYGCGRRSFALLGSVLLLILPVMAVIPSAAEEKAQEETFDCKSVSEPDVILSDAQCKALQYFFTDFVGEPITQISKDSSRDWLPHRHLVRLRVNRGDVCMRSDTPVICRFSDFSRYGKRPAAVAVNSKEEAFDRARPVLKYCNGPTNMAEYTINLDDWGSEWEIEHLPFTHKGIPYIGPHLTVNISTTSGKLTRLFGFPATTPKAEPEHIISARAAVKAAVIWKESVPDPHNMSSPNFVRSRARFSYFASWYTKKVIAWPNDRGDLDFTKSGWDEPHYCWSVPFYWYEDAFEGSKKCDGDILVDMETGQVISRR